MGRLPNGPTFGPERVGDVLRAGPTRGDSLIPFKVPRGTQSSNPDVLQTLSESAELARHVPDIARELARIEGAPGQSTILDVVRSFPWTFWIRDLVLVPEAVLYDLTRDLLDPERSVRKGSIRSSTKRNVRQRRHQGCLELTSGQTRPRRIGTWTWHRQRRTRPGRFEAGGGQPHRSPPGKRSVPL